MKKPHPKQGLYDKADTERSEQGRRIVEHPSRKKVVVAGPGTGKTHLFQQLLSAKRGKTLTLTFINALVDDLALSLFGLSEVRTLHGYALSVLQKKGRKIFPKLPEVIKEDYFLLNNTEADFKDLFQKEPINQERFDFYKKRKDYYGEYYGFSDI